jgi:ferredoxin
MHIIVTDHAGITHTLQAETGWRIMEIIRDWGVSIKAECGGCCLCATCHVYIDDAWIDKLIPPPQMMKQNALAMLMMCVKILDYLVKLLCFLNLMAYT